MNKNISGKIAKAPSEVLEKTLKTSGNFVNYPKIGNPIKKAKNFWHMLGPGLTTGAADDDPSGIATYSQTGSQYGFKLLWLAPLTFPLMAIVQEMCARIGLVTGQGLAANIKKHFSKKVLYICTFLLFVANTFNIGADLGAMAKATQLIAPNLNFVLLIFGFTILSLGLQIFLTYKDYAKYLKWLALILLSYVFTMFLVKIDYSVLLKNIFLPNLNFSKDQLFLICAIFGTTISPYLFFWQTSQEVEEEILIGKNTIQQRRTTSPKEFKKMRIDIWSGMFLSNLIMFCIIAVCAAVLNQNNITNIETAAQAAEALKPLAGKYASLLFTFGIIGVGLLAVPVLAGSASYALSEALGWKEGLYRKFKQAKAFYGIIIISMAFGLALNFIAIDPIKILIYAAVLNGLIAPIILILIVKISSSQKIMGQWANKKLNAFFGWLTVIIMGIIAMATILFFIL